MAHGLGIFFKYLAAFLVIAFSVTLGFLFFSQIVPPGIPWFIPAAMGLTEGGLLCWLAVFMWTRHDDAKKVLALLMVIACFVAVLVTDAVELASLFQITFIVTRQWVYLILIVMFAGHLLAFIIDFFISYFRRYAFRAPAANLIRTVHAQDANLIRSNVNVEELRAMHEAITGYLVAIQGGEHEAPLALKSPKETMSLAQVGEAVKEAASSVTKKVRSSIKSGKQAAPVPGNAKTNTSDDGLAEENSSEEIT